MDLLIYVTELALEPGITFFGRAITPEDATYFDSLGVARETANALIGQLAEQGLMPVPGLPFPQIKDGIATMDFDYAGPGLPAATPWSTGTKTCFVLKGFVQTSADMMVQGASASGQVIVPKGTVYPILESLGSLRARGEVFPSLSGNDQNRIPPPPGSDPATSTYSVEPTRLVWGITPDACTAYWAAPGK